MPRVVVRGEGQLPFRGGSGAGTVPSRGLIAYRILYLPALWTRAETGSAGCLVNRGEKRPLLRHCPAQGPWRWHRRMWPYWSPGHHVLSASEGPLVAMKRTDEHHIDAMGPPFPGLPPGLVPRLRGAKIERERERQRARQKAGGACGDAKDCRCRLDRDYTVQCAASDWPPS